MQPPPGYFVPDGHVCRLRRALYGLKQAPRAWFAHFTSVISAVGFTVSSHDPALFVHVSSRGRTLLLLYVHDTLIAGDDSSFIVYVKKHLSEQLFMTDLGSLTYFLGIEVSCVRLSIVVCFSLAPPHYSFRRTPMRPGLVILLIVVLFLFIVFFLAPP